MLATFVTEKKILSVHLPKKIEGKYWILDKELSAGKQQLFAIEASDDHICWKIKSTRNVYLAEDAKDICLQEGELYIVELGRNRSVRGHLFIQPFTSDYIVFDKYIIQNNAQLIIGRSEDNQIVIDNKYISGRHAKLEYKNGIFYISENPNSNGVYVNEARIDSEQRLIPGDCINILGFKIVIGSNFVAFNNPNNSVTFDKTLLQKMEYSDEITEDNYEEEDEPFYYRSPRFKREIVPLEMKVDVPTRQENIDDTPIIVTLAPTMIMGVASFSSAIITTTNTFRNGGNIMQSLPTLIMAVSMLCGMILFPFFMRKRERKRKAEKEQIRREKYLKYLDNCKEEITKNKKYQEEIARENNPHIINLASTENFWEQKLWYKMPGQMDYLFFRLGVGNSPMIANIKFPEDRFSVEDDYLRDELGLFQNSEQLLSDVPVGFSLLKNKAVGIVGDYESRLSALNNILLQIALLHSYDEVKLIFVGEEKEVDLLRYIRFIPHIWDNEKKRRYLVTYEDDVRDINNVINRIIMEKSNSDSGDSEGKNIHYIVITTSIYLANKCSFISDILKDESINGFSVVNIYDSTNNLPKECMCVVELNKSQGIMYSKNSENNKKNPFLQDDISLDKAKNLVLNIGKYQLDLKQGRYDLPSMLTFLDMFGVGKIEHLNIHKRWIDNNPVISLQTPIGVDTMGDCFMLDLHEKNHGPHGLVAGMTGSGKSEFIITFILSLAVNYHPNEVSFVLIDYKGGGLTGAFENDKFRLPHLAGTITNLDGASITRSILSIKSELRRRQEIFNIARNIANEGTMDIYKYQQMFRDGMVDEPIPHLFIISDEFAELKSQQPEFMEQLISTARIGRSLGVHLILATQKPSGVVNEQIWANSKFKICLKVQDVADSRDMLKRPDAAGLVETGRFYLQVGYNEIFELGQSAWCGAPYFAEENKTKTIDETIEVIDNLGNVTYVVKPENKDERKADGKQIVRIMEHISNIAKDENISVRQLWLPEIPEKIFYDDVISTYNFSVNNRNVLQAVVGETDNPYAQKKELYCVNFTNNGNLLIYGATGSGKEMYITSLLYSLICNYSVELFNFYILDFGAEILGMFSEAPQCGDVIIDGQSEKMKSFISMLSDEVRQRKKMLIEYGGDIEKYNSLNEKKLPSLLVVLNNYEHIIESYEKYEEILVLLQRDCPRYGIFFVATANAANSVRYRVTQNYKQFVTLNMNDKSDYFSIHGNTYGVYPPNIKGRGIFKTDETYVFQVALVGDGDQGKIVREKCTILRANSQMTAKKVPTIPRFISSSFISKNIAGMEYVPLGIAYDSFGLATHDFKKQCVLAVLSDSLTAVDNYCAGLIEIVSNIAGQRVVVLNPEYNWNEIINVNYERISEDYDKYIIDMFENAVARNNLAKAGKDMSGIDTTPMVVVINRLGDLKSKLDSDIYDKLISMIYKVEPFWNMYFILADSNINSGKYYSEGWYSSKVSGNGIWVGNEVLSQTRLSISHKTADLKQDINNRTGYYIKDGKARRMRLALPDALDIEEDEDE